MSKLFLFFLMLTVGLGAVHAQEVGQAQEPLPNFVTLRDPFLSVLPKAKIIKTPVEPAASKVNNTMSVRTPPAMLPQGAPAPSVNMPVLHVQGIIWGSDRPQAIIDDEVVGVGDQVQGVKITSIHKDGVNGLFQGVKFHARMDE